MNTRSSAVVIGAGSRIGASLCQQWCNDDSIENVIAISRQPIPVDNPENKHKVHSIQSEYDESSIIETCKAIKILAHSISRVCICNGILHNEDIWPEKRIEELNVNNLKDSRGGMSCAPGLMAIIKTDYNLRSIRQLKSRFRFSMRIQQLSYIKPIRASSRISGLNS